MITELPWELYKATNLSSMDVSHNPIVVPPKPIVTKGTAAMLAWLKANECTLLFCLIVLVIFFCSDTQKFSRGKKTARARFGVGVKRVNSLLFFTLFN